MASFILLHRGALGVNQRRLAHCRPPDSFFHRDLRSILESRFHLLGEIRSMEFIPLLRPTIHFFFPIAVSFLDDAEKFNIVAFRLHKIVVRQLAPSLLDLAFELLPATLELFLVHKNLPPTFYCTDIPKLSHIECQWGKVRFFGKLRTSNVCRAIVFAG